MGKRGPATKPRALKVVEGTRRDRVPDDEPVPDEAKPEYLADDVVDDPAAAVRRVFDQTVAELEAMGIAYRADSHQIRAYAEAVVLHLRAAAILHKTGTLQKGLHGGWVRNPAAQMMRDAAATMRGFAQEFGLTPSARTQLGLDKVTKAKAGAERLLS